MRYSSPPPQNRRIRPSFKRRVFFITGGVVAVILRFATVPWRRWLKRKYGANRVFIYEPYGMGDVLALQPLIISHLKAGAEVVLAARPEWAEIIPPHPKFTFLPLNQKYAAHDHKKKKYTDFLTAAATMRPYARGARGIDVRGDVRSIVLMYLAGCGRVYTLPRYFTANDSLVLPLAAHRVKLEKNVSRRLLNRSFAPEDVDYRRTTVTHLARMINVPSDSGRVGLIPMTPWIGKHWFPEFWREIIFQLRLENFDPVILCGPYEVDAALEATAAGDLNIECLECDSVSRWVTELAKCGPVISVNTGPMHLADALDKPLVVIEGSSRLPLWAPEGERSFVVHRQDVVKCAPCHQVGDTFECERQCMAMIHPHDVLAALQIVIKRSSDDLS